MILSYQYGERGTLNYYSRMPVREVDTAQEVDQYLKTQNPSFFITTNNQIKKLEGMGYDIGVINTLPFYPTSRMDMSFVLKWDRNASLIPLSIGTISRQKR